MSETLSVILPAYNEEDCILSTIDDVEKALKGAGLSYEIIVIDDGSKDRTAELARTRNVRLIQHPRNFGVGAARKTGISQSKGNIVITTDVDGTYPNDQIPALAKHFMDTQSDMVVGARIGKNVAYEWPHRAIPKFLIRKLASYLCQFNIPDLNSGLRVIRREIALKFFYLLPDSHSWESTITMAFLANKYKVEYVPIDYFKRQGGSSSFTPFRDTFNYISLVVRTIMYFAPLRIFVPLSFFILLMGCIKIVYDWKVFREIGGLDVVLLLFGVLVALVGILADLIVVTGRRLENYQQSQK